MTFFSNILMILLNLFERYSHLQQDKKKLYQIYSINFLEVTRGRFINKYSQMWISRSKNQVFKLININ